MSRHPGWLSCVFFFRFLLHPVSCAVRSSDESPDVLLLGMTEIEAPSNHTEKHLWWFPDTLLKTMLSDASDAFYKRALCRGCVAVRTEITRFAQVTPTSPTSPSQVLPDQSPHCTSGSASVGRR